MERGKNQSGESGDGDKKLDWMYQSSTHLINREEYLLGRKIDKSFELLQQEEQANDQKLLGVKQPLNHVEHECIPFSIRAYRGLDVTEQVDLQRKVMEDPLMLIKQREMESRRKLLENPVKLKELHRILKIEKTLKSDEKSKSKKKSKKLKSKKSKKKHKKHSKSSSSDDDKNSDDDLDRKLANSYKKLKDLQKDHDIATDISLTKLLDAKYETISKELDRTVVSKKKSTSSDYRTQRDRTHARSKSPKASTEKRHREERRGRSPSPQSYSRKYRRSRSRSPRNRTEKARSHKMTEEEKERRYQEMMKNAKWRESERANVVKQHRDAYEREEQQHRNQNFDKNFINKEVKKAIANHTSVSSRIRSNLNNIQRTSSSMNSNFTRK